MRKDLHEANRRSWNSATVAHNSHKGDQAKFLRDGGTTLFDEEIGLLGHVGGRSLVHLQCNAGQDTLSIARLGADVTGIDISDEAIAFATRLSAESGVPGRFVRADLFDWFDATEDRFDLAFASYGALAWLSDIAAWGRGVARVLKPGGRLVVVEIHPTLMMFDPQRKLHYDYSRRGRPLHDPIGVTDYVAQAGGALTPMPATPGVQDFANPHPSVSFDWGLADVIGAVLGAGMRLDTFVEWPYANGYKYFEEMRELPGRRWTMPDGVPEVPMMYGLAANRP